jgi:hypothetical protein
MASAELAGNRGGLDATFVAALLTSRDDAATQAFDAALQAAESAGTIDIDTARTLKYWQRQSIEGLVDHAAIVLPAAMSARRVSDISARETTAEARVSYEQARAIQREHADEADSSGDDDDKNSSDRAGEPTRRVTNGGLSVVVNDNSTGGPS